MVTSKVDRYKDVLKEKDDLAVKVEHSAKEREALDATVTEISANEVEKFAWKHLIWRYGLPCAILTNNDTQFKAQTYKEFLSRLGIKHLITSFEHPQKNG